MRDLSRLRLIAAAQQAITARDAVLQEAGAEIDALRARIDELETGNPVPDPEPEPESEVPQEPQPPLPNVPSIIAFTALKSDAEREAYIASVRGWYEANTGPRIELINDNHTSVSGHVKGRRFNESIEVAEGTVLEDCEINSDGFRGVFADWMKFTLINCRVIGRSGSRDVGVQGVATVINTEISGFQDGIKLQGTAAVRGSLIHKPYKTSTSHNDGIAIQWDNTDHLIEHNFIDWIDTSCIFLKNESGQVKNITIRRNWLMGTTGWPINAGPNIPGCKAIENVIQRGAFGHMSFESPVEAVGNLDATMGTPI